MVLSLVMYAEASGSDDDDEASPSEEGEVADRLPSQAGPGDALQHTEQAVISRLPPYTARRRVGLVCAHLVPVQALLLRKRQLLQQQQRAQPGQTQEASPSPSRMRCREAGASGYMMTGLAAMHRKLPHCRSCETSVLPCVDPRAAKLCVKHSDSVQYSTWRQLMTSLLSCWYN